MKYSAYPPSWQAEEGSIFYGRAFDEKDHLAYPQIDVLLLHQTRLVDSEEPVLPHREVPHERIDKRPLERLGIPRKTFLHVPFEIIHGGLRAGQDDAQDNDRSADPRRPDLPRVIYPDPGLFLFPRLLQRLLCPSLDLFCGDRSLRVQDTQVPSRLNDQASLV